MNHRRCAIVVLACLGLAGCLPEPKLKDRSQLINGGVNLIPEPVLAAEKQHPSTAPVRRAGDDLIESIQSSDQKHYCLVEVLRESGLVPLLQTEGPYTIFAPTDAAFDKMPPGLLDDLLLPKNHEILVRFARYHILRGRVDADALTHTNGQVQTMSGPPASPTLGANSPARPMGSALIVKGFGGGKVMVNDANILRTDTAANNGIIHWIDGVLIPPPRQDGQALDAVND